VEQQQDQFVSGGHLFEARVEGSGPKCLAEEQIDDVAEMTASLLKKAEDQQRLLDESIMRARRIENEEAILIARMQAAHVKADRFCGKK